jgi:hypothetical protein
VASTAARCAALSLASSLQCDNDCDGVQLDSSDAVERENACDAIASLLTDDATAESDSVKRLLGAGVIRKLLPRVCDPEHRVALHALAALR